MGTPKTGRKTNQKGGRPAKIVSPIPGKFEDISEALDRPVKTAAY